MLLHRIVDNLPHLIGIIALTLASGFFSAGETALFSLSRQQLGQLRQSSHLPAQLILRLREDPAALLSTILLGNTLVNILLYSIVAVTCTRLAGGSVLATTLLSIPAFGAVILFAEIVPKLLAFVAGAQIAPLVATPLRLIQMATAPIRWVLDNLVVEPLSRILSPTPPPAAAVEPEELQKLVHVSLAQGLIDGRENTMLHQLLDLSSARVANLMVPRVDVVAFDLADDQQKLVELIKSSRLLHIPVYEETIDNVRGAILAREFLANPDRPLSEFVQPVRFIPEQASVEALLQHFRATGSQSALVVDEYGGLAGVVALEDVVEEIVGELYAPDELSPLPPLRKTDEKTFLVEADLDLDDFRRAFELEIEETRFNTVGGLVAAELNRSPQRGDQIVIGAGRLTVVAMRRRRILQVRLELDRPMRDNPDLSRLLETPAESADAPAVRSHDP